MAGRWWLVATGWELGANTYKPYPCGVVLNAVIEALGKIRDTEQARLDAKRRLRLLAHSLRDVLRSRSGGSRSGKTFSR